MVTLKTPFRYPGGKSKMLPQIWEHLEPMLENASFYIEPFVGGGSVMLHVAQKYPKINIFINDKNIGMYNFWSIVTGKDQNAINDLLSFVDQSPTLDLYKEIKDSKSTDPVFSAYRSLFLNRCNFSGIEMSGPIGGKEQKSKYKIDCRYNKQSLRKNILEINKLTHGRVVCSNLDITEYIHLWENNYTTYIDPPYVAAGEELYIHSFSNKDHENLAMNLQSRKNWLLSYDDCNLIRYLYKDKEIIDLAVRYSINGKKNNWAKKNELLIKNKII